MNQQFNILLSADHSHWSIVSVHHRVVVTNEKPTLSQPLNFIFPSILYSLKKKGKRWNRVKACVCGSLLIWGVENCGDLSSVFTYQHVTTVLMSVTVEHVADINRTHSKGEEQFFPKCTFSFPCPLSHSFNRGKWKSQHNLLIIIKGKLYVNRYGRQKPRCIMDSAYMDTREWATTAADPSGPL